MSEVHHARLQAILDRIMARLGISVDDLVDDFIADCPPLDTDAERAKAIADLERLVEEGVGPPAFLGGLVEILKSAST